MAALWHDLYFFPLHIVIMSYQEYTQFEKVDILILRSLAKRQVAKMSPSRCQFGSNDIMFVLRVQLAQINTQQTDYENLMLLARGIPHPSVGARASATRPHASGFQRVLVAFSVLFVFPTESPARLHHSHAQRKEETGMPLLVYHNRWLDNDMNMQERTSSPHPCMRDRCSWLAYSSVDMVT